MESNAQPEMTRKSKIIYFLIFTYPIWLTILYYFAANLELKYTNTGPVKELAALAFFGIPAVGSIAIFTLPDTPTYIKVLLSAIYYPIALVIVAIIGWGVF